MWGFGSSPVLPELGAGRGVNLWSLSPGFPKGHPDGTESILPPTDPKPGMEIAVGPGERNSALTWGMGTNSTPTSQPPVSPGSRTGAFPPS